MELYDHFKSFYRGRQEPRWLFQKPLQEGFLYHLGLWLYERYILTGEYREELGGEYLVWYAEEFLEFLATHGLSADPSGSCDLKGVLERIGDLYGHDEDAYFRLVESYRSRQAILRIVDSLVAFQQAKIIKLACHYALNYAERVFHDRELCDFISNLLVQVGFDGTTGEEEPGQWVQRPSIPAWLSRAVVARERGLCASCCVAITQELSAIPNLDHIVPLSKGGCNDMVNFQLLCDKCNKRKQGKRVPVTGSIPKYLQRK